MPVTDDPADVRSGNATPATPIHPMVAELLDTIRRQYPNVPFLALGQTVFWDEPTKAVWSRILDVAYPDATMIAGVHDTDYFAKLPTPLHTDKKFAVVTHDDGATRDLWSAAGELSALFGSESIPTRQRYLKRGVPFDWLTRGAPSEKAARYAALTTAWGWRGLVRTDALNVVASDLPASDFVHGLRELLDWGFAESLMCLAEGPVRANAKRVVDEIKGWVDEFMSDCDRSCRLSDLYEWLIPRFYGLLLGRPPINIETTTSTVLFQFNRDTCSAPKFAILDAFLNPATRRAAATAYNSAVTGSGIYPLGNFGEGAIPFDLVVPKLGRGTIFVRHTKTIAELGPEHYVEVASRPVQSAADLAEAIEERFGRRAALVGKAVILADMIAAEHIVLFHETASGYTSVTRKLNDVLAANGMPLTIYPIVRLTYPTWNTVGVAEAEGGSEVSFVLPDHLAATFGKRDISARELSMTWGSVVEHQLEVLAQTATMKRLRDLLVFLEEKDPQRTVSRSVSALLPPTSNGSNDNTQFATWSGLRDEYEEALALLRRNAQKSIVLRGRIEEHRQQSELWQNERIKLERRMGEDWRASVLPLIHKQAEATPEETEALQQKIDKQLSVRSKAFEEPIETMHSRIIATRELIAAFRRERRAIERSPEALAARGTVVRIMREAQAARLAIVRNAYLTVEGLEHTHLRPTSWWLPLVDHSGRWFDAMVEGTTARFEHLWPQQPTPARDGQ